MLLKRIHIQNFRSVCNAEIELSTQTAILGGNGVGKSTILKALDRFYGASTQVELTDFFNRDAREPIRISLTFHKFSDDEVTRFASRIHNGEMSVMRVFEAAGRQTGHYFGLTMRNTDFTSVREISGANEKKLDYKRIKESDPQKYAALPTLTKAAEIEDALLLWEEANVQHCQLALDDGRFFGFTNVANGALQKSTAFVFIPAVRDAAADAVDNRSSAIAKLMELVVRSAIQQREDIQTWQARISQEYRTLTNPDNLPELNTLADDLTKTLQHLYSESSVDLQWKPATEFDMPLPTADVALEDGGFQTSVDRQGHGLQRAFIITLLQHLALAVNGESAQEPRFTGPGILGSLTAVPMQTRSLPGLILAIEEPELYQHPAKQRHFASVLHRLTAGTVPGVAATTQVIFASHSPYFVSVDRFDEVRVARRHMLSGSDCQQCRVTEASLAVVAARLEGAFLEQPGSRDLNGLRSRLHIFSSDLAEGFFADLVVLAEGPSDKAALLATANLLGIDLEALGVSVLVVDGKQSMPNPAAIFITLGIPTYLVWDCDLKAGKPEHEYNSVLQRLTQAEPRTANIRVGSTFVSESFAMFQTCLDDVLRVELGTQLYADLLATLVVELSLTDRKNPEKFPAVVTALVARAASHGYVSNTMRQIVEAIANAARASRSRS